MTGRPRILMLSTPGLSARMLRRHRQACPGLEALLPTARVATIEPIDASPEQSEAAMLTGMLPPWTAQTFADKAAASLPDGPGVSIHRLPVPARDPDDALHEISRHVDAGLYGALVVAAPWAWLADGGVAGPGCHPLDRPVLITHGLEQSRPVIGLCELAGLLERALTGERLRDAL
jgi:hypothetical protein